MSLLQEPFIQNSLTFFSLKAFRPDEQDMTAPLQERFAGQSILAIAIYPTAIKLGKINFSSSSYIVEYIESYRRHSQNEHDLVQILTEIKAKYPNLAAAVTYNYGYNAQKSFTIRKSDNLWSMQKDSAQALLGDDYENDHYYSVVPHEARESGLIFAYDERSVEEIEKALKQVGINCVRLQQNIGTLFEYALSKNKGLLPSHLLIVSGNSLLYLEVDVSSDSEWNSLRNRSENQNSMEEETRKHQMLTQVLPQRGALLLCLDQVGDFDQWEQRIRDLRPELQITTTLEEPITHKTEIFYALARD